MNCSIAVCLVQTIHTVFMAVTYKLRPDACTITTAEFVGLTHVLTVLFIRTIVAVLVLVADQPLFDAGAAISAAELVCFAHLARSCFVALGFITAITAVHMTIAPIRQWQTRCIHLTENLSCSITEAMAELLVTSITTVIISVTEVVVWHTVLVVAHKLCW